MDFREPAEEEQESLTPVSDVISDASFRVIVNEHRQRARVASEAAREAYDSFLEGSGTVMKDSVQLVVQMAFQFAYQTYVHERMHDGDSEERA